MTKTNKKYLIAVLTALMVVVTAIACFIGFNAVPKQAKAEEIQYKKVRIDLKQGDTLANRTIYCKYGTIFNVYLDNEKSTYLNFQSDVGLIDYYIDSEVVGSATYFGGLTSDCSQGYFELGETLNIQDYDEEDVNYTIDLTKPIYEISKDSMSPYNVVLYQLTDEILANVKNQEVFELQVGDTLAGKTLVLNSTMELGTYIITLSNGIKLQEDCAVMTFSLDNGEWSGFYLYSEDRQTLGEDGCTDNYYEFDNETIFSTDYMGGGEKYVLNLEGVTVTEIRCLGTAPIRYFITNPVSEEPEEPETVEPDVPAGEQPDVPADEPTEDKKDDIQEEPKQDADDVKEEKLSVEDIVDWMTDNIAIVVIGLVVLIIVISAVVKKKRG